MDLRRFLDLYTAETQEHLRTLQRSLLALEAGRGDAVDEAFRSVHTIKGLSAAMGYQAVAERAHRLEDTLAGVRHARRAVSADEADALLAERDALERDIATAVATLEPRLEAAPVPGPGSATGPADGGADATRPRIAVPKGTAQVLTVQLRGDAALKGARALLVMRALEGRAGVLGSTDPLGAADDARLHVFLGADADAAALRAVALDAGDVDSATLWAPKGGARAAAGTAGGAEAADAPPRPVAQRGRQVRVDERRLDGLAEGIGELSVLRNRLLQAGGADADGTMLDRMGSLLGELQLAVLAMRMVPLAEVFERLPRVVRDAARRTGKDVELEMRGEEIELDRAILNEIGEPLVHLLRNAVDHGIEDAAGRARAKKSARGRILLQAERERSSIRIVLEDDGAGVDRGRVAARAKAEGLLAVDAPEEVPDQELFRLLSSPGFSTADGVSDVSGRGVGLDTVMNRVRALGGAVDMHTERGRGTRFALRLPITLALVRALRVRVGGEDYAIPLTHITEAVHLRGTERTRVAVREERLRLVRLREVLQVRTPGRETAAVVAELGDRRAALAVDELVGHEQILVKSFDPSPGTLPVFSGATLLEDGRPALVLDPLSVM